MAQLDENTLHEFVGKMLGDKVPSAARMRREHDG